MNFELSHIPFIAMSRNGLDWWQKAKQSQYMTGFNPAEVTFVSISDIKEKARTLDKSNLIPPILFGPSVWSGTVGFMSRSWVNKYKGKKEYNYRFGTGIYRPANELLLVDDIFDWAHHRKEKNKVRTCLDIIVAVKKRELNLDI